MPGQQRRKMKPIEEPPSWKERLRATRHLPTLIRLVWGTHRGYCVAMVILRSVRAVLPVAVLWIGKLIIDSVVALAAHTPSGDPLLPGHGHASR